MQAMLFVVGQLGHLMQDSVSAQLNEACEGPEFELAQRYGEVNRCLHCVTIQGAPRIRAQLEYRR